METLTIILEILFVVSVILVFLKTIIGFHFPWEKCSCCGKRLDKNHVPLSARKSIREVEKEIEEEFEKWDTSDKAWEKAKQKLKNKED